MMRPAVGFLLIEDDDARRRLLAIKDARFDLSPLLSQFLVDLHQKLEHDAVTFFRTWYCGREFAGARSYIAWHQGDRGYRAFIQIWKINPEE